MDIMITGISGFVGSHLVKALTPAHRIYGLDIVQPTIKGVDHVFLWEELAQGAIPPVDAVIHLAGMAHDTKNNTLEKVYFDVNVGLTKALFNHHCHHNNGCFIFFSSVKAAADTVEGEWLTEEEIPHPKGPYGESKLAAECYIDENRTHTGGKVYILRPCVIEGPGTKGNLRLLRRLAQKGIPWPLAAYNNKRSYLSITTLTMVITRLLEQRAPSGTYNVADDRPLSTNDLFRQYCTDANRSVRLWHLPKGVVWAMAQVGNHIPIPLNSDRLQKLTENYVVCNHKLKKALDATHELWGPHHQKENRQ